LAGLFAGARRTALLADRFAVFLAGARLATFVADVLREILPTGDLATLVAGAFRTAFLVDVLVVFFRAFSVVTFAVEVVLRTGVGVALSAGRGVLPFTMPFRVLLAEKRTPFDAAIFTGAPVCGLRPMRAPRCVGLKRPKPTTETRRPERTSLMTVWTTALTAFSASRFVNDVVVLIASIRPDLFTAVLLRVAESQQSKKVFASRSSICAAKACWRARFRARLHDGNCVVMGPTRTSE
jgi:hypothetical protein